MRCPACGKGPVRVTKTVGGKGKVERRRLCLACGKKMRTLEEPAVVALVRVSRLRAPL